MKPPIDDARTEPDGVLGGPVNTEERNIGALLEGLDEPQPPPARASGSDLRPRAQLETALLPDVDRRKRRKGAVVGLVIGLTVTFIAGTLAFRTVFVTRDADAAAAVTAVDPSPTHPRPSASSASGTIVAAPPGTWVSPTNAIPAVAASSLPAAPATVSTSPSGGPSGVPAAAPVAKRPTRPTSSSPGEPRRGYGLTSDEP